MKSLFLVGASALGMSTLIGCAPGLTPSAAPIVLPAEVAALSCQEAVQELHRLTQAHGPMDQRQALLGRLQGCDWRLQG